MSAHSSISHVHGSGARTYTVVLAALLALTAITVGVSYFQFGNWNVIVALSIASTKATLVALYFMHLRYDRPIYAIIFLGTLLFVTLFVGLALVDTQSYQPEMIPGYAPAIPQ